MEIYKLVYFDLKGRAEVCRILFALSGKEYIDERISFDDWPKVKPTTPFLKAPVLEIIDIESQDVIQIAQSSSIMRFLANKFGFSGKNEIEKAQTDMLYEQINDMFENLVFIYKKRNEEEKNADLYLAYNTTIPTSLGLIQNILDKNIDKSGYLVGDSLTYADVALINFYDWLRDYKESILEKLPLLKQHYEFIISLPAIKQHIYKYRDARISKLF
nr:glutathione S-transferase GSTS8-1 [Brachionus angularis]